MLKSILILLVALLILYNIHPFLFFLAVGALIYYVLFHKDEVSGKPIYTSEKPEATKPAAQIRARSSEAAISAGSDNSELGLMIRVESRVIDGSRRVVPANARTAAPKRYESDFLKLRDLEFSKAPAFSHTTDYAIPVAPAGTGKVRWVPAGEEIEVQGVRIPGGMLYVGKRLRAADGNIDPCLIDPDLKVCFTSSYRERLMSYWPRYASITDNARGAYLKWLAQGRSDPAADLGYVFLFFYGLERRAMVELGLNRKHATELGDIAAEVRRLLDIYGGSRSFNGYAGGFLDLLDVAIHGDGSFMKVTASRSITRVLPSSIRFALGEASFKGAPVPAQLALAWVKGDGQFKRPVEMQRNAEIFDATFLEMYEKEYGAGIRISPNKTKIALSYKPASSGFANVAQSVSIPAPYPDITVLTGPVRQVQKIVDEVANGISAYGRYLAKNPGAEEALQALGLLPVPLWPAKPTAELERIKVVCSSAPLVATLENVLQWFDGKEVSREQFKLFLQNLANEGLGMEPDVLFGARMPKPEEHVCLYTLPGGVANKSSEAFMSALVVLEVSSAIAHADNIVTSDEEEHLLRQVESWPDLNAIERAKLTARARLLIASPVSLTALKSRIEPLSKAVKEAIAIACASMVTADGEIKQGELKVLERVYTMLSLDKTRAYAAVQAAAAIQGASEATPAHPPSAVPSMQLNLARIRALKEETTEVSALLGAIFVEEAAAEPSVTVPAENDPSPELLDERLLPALDEAHTSFTRVIISRARWSRSELSDVAIDLNIMLEGALERINEAAFEQHDMPLTEGDDPIEVNAYILELLPQ